MTGVIMFRGTAVSLDHIADCVRETENLADYCGVCLSDRHGGEALVVQAEAAPTARIEELKIQAAYRLSRRIETRTGVIAAVEVHDPGALPKQAPSPLGIRPNDSA